MMNMMVDITVLGFYDNKVEIRTLYANELFTNCEEMDIINYYSWECTLE